MHKHYNKTKGVYIDKDKVQKGKRGGSILYILTLEEFSGTYLYEVNENPLIPESSIWGTFKNLSWKYGIIYSNWWINFPEMDKEQQWYYGHKSRM